MFGHFLAGFNCNCCCVFSPFDFMGQSNAVRALVPTTLSPKSTLMLSVEQGEFQFVHVCLLTPLYNMNNGMSGSCHNWLS